MCVAVPAKIININDKNAEINSMGVIKIIDISLVPEAKPGDFVIVHAGFAIQVIDKDEAEKVLELFDAYSE
ncbi:MAG: HypC/HybG/HupF family hydrogenase formation chaperone [Actinobacteria bacterium]|nr:HypC/HybG/HupF family hydrogenase formation chaperone [Actinomycetota bacterium]